MLKITPLKIHLSLILYMAGIFVMSSIPGDNLPKSEFEFSDKLVHAVVFMGLFILFFYSLKYQSKSVTLRKNSLSFAAIFSALYGLTDELHQRFVPMRSCELADWIADVTGVIIGMILTAIIERRFRSGLPLLFLLMTFTSCRTTDKSAETEDSLKIAGITTQEAWVDNMPVLDERGPRLGFLITIDALKKEDSLTVQTLYISRSGGDFELKPFETISETGTGGRQRLMVIQARDVQYYREKIKDEDTFAFRIHITDRRGGRQTLMTSIIKPYKVY